MKRLSGQSWVYTHEAAKEANVCKATIVNWCLRYGAGQKVGGRWRIDRDSLHGILLGNAQGEVRNEAR